MTNAAVEILSDGKVRGAEEIFHEALARHLIPPSTTMKYVYNALIEYIAREIGHERKPVIIQTPDRRFRINEPPDDWPDLDPAAHAMPSVDAETHSGIVVRSDPGAAQ